MYGFPIRLLQAGSSYIPLLLLPVIVREMAWYQSLVVNMILMRIYMSLWVLINEDLY